MTTTAAATYELVEIRDGQHLKLLKVLNDCNNNNNNSRPGRALKVVIIPGNPGLVEFYEQFACELTELTQCPVTCISHTGHLYDHSVSSWQPADVEQQIDDKVKFIEQHFGQEDDKESDVVLIGHSIGCYVILQLLDRLDGELKKRVKKAVLLFPTVERMSETPNGRVLTLLTKNVWFLRLIYLLVLVVTWLPAFVRQRLVDSLYLKSKKNASAKMQLVDNMAGVLGQMTKTFACVRSILHMGRDEMARVRRLDKRLVIENGPSLVLYYGTRDRWCPVDYYFDMLDMVSKNIPEVSKKPQVLLDKLDLSHGFVVHKNQCSTMAKLVADWIKTF